MKLVFPGKFGALAGNDFEDMQRPPGVHTICDLIVWLGATRPALGKAMGASHTKIIVNLAIVHDALHAIADDDEIAFLPPMSGG